MDGQLYCPLMDGKSCMGRGCACATESAISADGKVIFKAWACGFVKDGRPVDFVDTHTPKTGGE